MLKYLGTILPDKNKVEIETQEKIVKGNKCYYVFQSFLKARNINKNMKVRLYKTVLI